jgi:hypothetical protein
MPLQPFSVYNQQLSSHRYGYALWEPDPGRSNDHVSIGDVGYIRKGRFVRMFNVLLPWNHPRNGTHGGTLEPYDQLAMPFINTHTSTFGQVTYPSRYVTAEGPFGDSE